MQDNVLYIKKTTRRAVIATDLNNGFIAVEHSLDDGKWVKHFVKASEKDALLGTGKIAEVIAYAIAKGVTELPAIEAPATETKETQPAEQAGTTSGATAAPTQGNQAMQTTNQKTDINLAVIYHADQLPALFGEQTQDGNPKILGVVEAIEQQAGSIVFDITTKAGQETCRKISATVAKAKTAIDNAGKTKKEEYTVFTKRIDSDRNLAKNRLQALQDAIRQPLTDMENAEKQRKEMLENRLNNLENYFDVYTVTSAAVGDAITALQNTLIDESWGEYQSIAAAKKAQELDRLQTLFTQAQQREADAAELAALRAAQAEQQRIAQEQAMLEQARQAAAYEAEQKILAAQRAAEAAAAAAENAERIAFERLEAKQAAEAQAEAQRVANEQHRAAVIEQTVTSLCDYMGMPRQNAETFVNDVINGEITNLFIKF